MSASNEHHSEDRTAVVVGASGGIGSALTAGLGEDSRYRRVYAAARSFDPGESRQTVHLDVTDETSVARAAESCAHDGGLDLVIVASGMLHDFPRQGPEKSWSDIDADTMARSFAVNCTGPALVAKHFLPLLARGRRSVFAALAARVGSIGDNRLGGWYAYRASKAALAMTIRTLAIELGRRRPEAICVGLHPGTVDTPLSAPFQARVPEGRLFTPEFAAQRLLEVIENVARKDSGNVIAWDGTTIIP